MFQKEQVVERAISPEVPRTQTYLHLVLFAKESVVRRLVVRCDGAAHHRVILFPQSIAVQAGKRSAHESVLQVVGYPLANADESALDFAVRRDLNVSHVGTRKVRRKVRRCLSTCWR